MAREERYDVVIIGAGLAGLSLARQLMMSSDKTVLLLEKRSQLPPSRQKVGESLVQVGGYYFSRVLDLEEYLLCNHYLKYNLRFYWKSSGRDNRQFENYGQAYIRDFSNIACYQLDRNEIEKELLESNQANQRFQYLAPVRIREVALTETGPHRVRFGKGGEERTVEADWVVDASGRNKLIARQKELTRDNPIHHGTAFLWVDGLVNIEKLTDRDWTEVRLNQDRKALGHLPAWLATNHFMGEGFWFWVIPLQGKTSLGLVYDNRVFPAQRVSTAEGLIDWVCQEFPLLERDLPERKVLDFGKYQSFSYGCRQTIDDSRWAMTGEAGRFTDPLYSPGSDFIAIHNTLIVDAILTDDPTRLAVKCRLYELLMKSFYESLLPSFSTSYDALGDEEAFVFKYTWELSVYFVFFVFPFINDLLTDTRFLLPFLNRFARLGAVNRNLQSFLSGYYQWKKQHRPRPSEPVFHDFRSLQALKQAESTFYKVGLSAPEALAVLDEQLGHLEELARLSIAHISSEVLEDRELVTDGGFVDSIDIEDFPFDPDCFRTHQTRHATGGGGDLWSQDPHCLDPLRTSLQLARKRAAARG